MEALEELGDSEIMEALEELGDSESAVALSLQQKGIKGACGKLTSCPIANYLKSLGYEDVSVTKEEISIYDEVGSLMELVGTPVSIANFITNFDLGAYPKLLE